MLDQRRRRWTSYTPALGQRLVLHVLAGCDLISLYPWESRPYQREAWKDDDLELILTKQTNKYWISNQII